MFFFIEDDFLRDTICPRVTSCTRDTIDAGFSDYTKDSGAKLQKNNRFACVLTRKSLSLPKNQQESISIQAAFQLQPSDN